MDDVLMPLAPVAGCAAPDGHRPPSWCRCVGCVVDALVGRDPGSCLEALMNGSFVATGLVDPAAFIGWPDLEQLITAPGPRCNLNRDSRRIGNAPLASLGPSVANGETLQVQDSERANLRLALLCAELQRRVGEGPVGCNIYLSARVGVAALKPHRDQVDAVIVQLAGEKHWTVWEPDGVEGADLLRETLWMPPADGGRVVVEAVLEPGDVLYLRRGDPHAAVCTSAPSLHLTIGLHRVNGQDVLEALVDEARRQGAFAASPPQMMGDGSAAGDAGWLADQLGGITRWIAELDAGSVRNLMDGLTRARFDDAGRASPDVGLRGCWPRLALVSGADAVGHADVVLAAPALLTARTTESHVSVTGDDQVPLKPDEHRLVMELLRGAGHPMTVGALAAGLGRTPSDVARWVGRLSDEGLVMVQKARVPCPS